MQSIFLTIVDMSIMASVIILSVLILRLLLKHMPKVFSYVLWLVVLFRLLCPWKIESDFSMIPNSFCGIPQELALEEADSISFTETIASTYEAIGDAMNGGLEILQVKTNSEQLGNNGYVPAFHFEVWFLFFGYVWLFGVFVMLVSGMIQELKFRYRLVGALKLEYQDISSLQENKDWLHKKYRIYLSDYVDTPFVIGIISPKIYLPSTILEEKTYILLHEQYHIYRGDHFVRRLYFIALCLHWMNPLVWLAFSLAGKDMEMSCDEAVIKKLGVETRTQYSQVLLNFATGKQNFVGAPLAFGEGDTKSRIKHLLTWKKQNIWVLSSVFFLLCILVVVFLFSPKTTETRVMGATERLRIICGDAIMVPRGTPLEVRESLEKLYRREAPAFLLEKCRARGASRGLLPDSVGVTGAVTRWGSCSSSGHISFCWKIMLLPGELADYIICHELAHLKELNHSPAFWQLTETLCPNALAKRKRLNPLPPLWPES